MKKINDNLKVIGIDSKKERCEQSEQEFGIHTMENLNVALAVTKTECVVVSTSPLSHASIINKCLKTNCNVFTELNLVSDGYEENIKLANDNDKTLFIS